MPFPSQKNQKKLKKVKSNVGFMYPTRIFKDGRNNKFQFEVESIANWTRVEQTGAGWWVDRRWGVVREGTHSS